MNISDFITLLGGAALFLFGMALMGDNLKKVAGSRLELILYRLSGTPLKGILLGTGVTAVIQSSSATSVMVVGFVNSGMMTVRQAIGVIMGAIIGTSVTGWVICLSALGSDAAGLMQLLSTETLSAVIAVIGILMRMICHSPERKHTGDIMLGFSVLMFGMSAMSGSVSGLRSDPAFIRLITAFSNPILGILVGTCFTAVLQSCSAAVGILQALSSTGAITFDVAFSLIMGIAIGAAVPVLLSAAGADRDGRKAAWSYPVVTAAGVLLFSVVFYSLNAALHFSFMADVMDVFSIALMNTVFRIITIILVLPFLQPMEKICDVLAGKDKNSCKNPGESLQLEDRFLAHPGLALEQSRLAVNHMALTTSENLRFAVGLLYEYSDAGYEDVRISEDLIDSYEDALGAYLVRITGPELNDGQKRSVGRFLRVITDLERMSDHALNIAESAGEKNMKGIAFSAQAQKELNVLAAAVQEIIRLAVKALIDDDLEAAIRIEPLEEHIDNMCDIMKARHIERVQSGVCSLLQGFVFNDLLTNFERVADHCSNIGVAEIEFCNGSVGAHRYLLDLRADCSSTFDDYYAEYSASYSI